MLIYLLQGGSSREAMELGRMSTEQAARVHLGRLAELCPLSPRAAETLPAVTQALAKSPSLVTFRHDLDGVEVFRESLKLLLAT